MATEASPSPGDPPPRPDREVFEIRLNTIDYYMSKPIPGLDDTESAFLGTTVDQVPIVRVFGETPGGQKACLHIHDVFPYLYVPYDDDLPKDAEGATTFLRKLADALDAALDYATVAAGEADATHPPPGAGVGGALFASDTRNRNTQMNPNAKKNNPPNHPGSNTRRPFAQAGPGPAGASTSFHQKYRQKRRRVVHAISLVTARSMYGFHASDTLFVKISVYDPSHISRLRACLLSGGIHGRIWQPHEAHVPYILQTMMDHNLHGGGLVSCASVVFRDPLPRWGLVHTHRVAVRRQFRRVTRLDIGGEVGLTGGDGETGTEFRGNKAKREPVQLEYEDVDPVRRGGGLFVFDHGGCAPNGSGGNNASGASHEGLVLQTPDKSNNGVHQKVWTAHTVPNDWTFVSLAFGETRGAPPARTANCELELDVVSSDIKNWTSLSLDLDVGNDGNDGTDNDATAGAVVRLVPSLRSVWQDEARRAFAEGQPVVPAPVPVARDAFSETSIAKDANLQKLQRRVELAACAELNALGVPLFDLRSVFGYESQTKHGGDNTGRGLACLVDGWRERNGNDAEAGAARDADVTNARTDLDLFATAVPANRASLATASQRDEHDGTQPLSQPSQPSRRVSNRLAPDSSALLRQTLRSQNTFADGNQSDDDFEQLSVDRDTVVLSQAAVAASPQCTHDSDLFGLLMNLAHGVDGNGETIGEDMRAASISAVAYAARARNEVERNLFLRDFEDDDYVDEAPVVKGAHDDAMDDGDFDAFAVATQREWGDIEDVMGTADEDDDDDASENPVGCQQETIPAESSEEHPAEISDEQLGTPPPDSKICWICQTDCSLEPRQRSLVTGYAHKRCLALEAAVHAEAAIARRKRRASASRGVSQSLTPSDFVPEGKRLKRTPDTQSGDDVPPTQPPVDSRGRTCVECNKQFHAEEVKYLVNKRLLCKDCHKALGKTRKETKFNAEFGRRNSQVSRFGKEAGVGVQPEERTWEQKSYFAQTEPETELETELGDMESLDVAALPPSNSVDETESFARYALRRTQTPPTRARLVSTLRDHDLPDVIHQPVFYGNPHDVPSRPVLVAGVPMPVPTTTSAGCAGFFYAGNSRDGGNLRNAFRVTNGTLPDRTAVRVRYALRPLRPPPSNKTLERWRVRRLGVVGDELEITHGAPGFLTPSGSLHTPKTTAKEGVTVPPPSPYHPPSHVSLMPSFGGVPGTQHESAAAQFMDAWLDSLELIDLETGGGGVSSGRGQSGPAQIGLGDTIDDDDPLPRPCSPKYEEIGGDYSELLRYNGCAAGNDEIAATRETRETPNSPSVSDKSFGPGASKSYARRFHRHRRSGALQMTAPTNLDASTPGSSDVGFVSEKKEKSGGDKNKGDPVAGAPVPPMGVLCVEIIGDTRNELSPDPQHDRVLAIGVSYSSDNGATRREIALALRASDRCDVAGTEKGPPVTSVVSPSQTQTQSSNSTPVFQEIDPSPWVFGTEIGVPNANVETHVFADEPSLLIGFANTVKALDPDVLLGFEIQAESLGFLITRGTVLGVDLVRDMSRAENLPGANERQDDEYGRLHASGIYVTGRIVLNLWRVLRGELKLQSYTFEACASHVLKKRVAKFTPGTVSRWGRGGRCDSLSCESSGLGETLLSTHQQWRAVTHVTQKATFVMRMCEHLDVVARTNEQAKIFGIDFQSVLFRGSQYRVESMMLRLAHRDNFLAPSPSNEQAEAQPGMECIPLVMEPETKMYTNPVAVLDFASLYPSVVCAYNLCYSTCLGKVPDERDLRNLEVRDGNTSHKTPNQIAGLGGGPPRKLGCFDLALPAGLLPALVGMDGGKPTDTTTPTSVTVTPNGVMFAKPKIRQGILPRLLTEILDTRVMVKSVLKRCALSGDPGSKPRRRALTAKQTGLKLIANVTYGYTAAGFSGRMPMAELADAIVQCGRETLERAIRTVHAGDKRWDGARVVYGDTDSLFVEFPGYTRAQAFEAAACIARVVTADNPDPVTLKLEKIYHPCILVAKKRYVGHAYETPSQTKPHFDAKGIEHVRRDSCPLLVKMQKTALQLLFHTKDLSLVKRYVQRNVAKLRSGRLPLQDLVFAKETRLGTYSTKPGSTKPPAVIVAESLMSKDPGLEPKFGERVPYLVVSGAPGSRVVDAVIHPSIVVNSQGTYRVNAKYYCDKILAPAMQRVFGLVGGDVFAWLREPNASSLGGNRVDVCKRLGMGNNTNLRALRKNNTSGPNTIDNIFHSAHCAVCFGLTSVGRIVCLSCGADAAYAAATLAWRAVALETQKQKLHKVCLGCGGGGGGDASLSVGFSGCGTALGTSGCDASTPTRQAQRSIPAIECVSLDCSVFFTRRKTETELETAVAHVERAFTPGGGLG